MKKTKDGIMKNIRNLSRLKKELTEIDDTAIKDIRNLFRLKNKKTKQLKLE